MSKRAVRPLGDITTDIEPLIQELMYAHQLQYHEILGIVYAYLLAHYPEGREVYTADKSYAVFYYGHKEGLK